MLSRSIRTSFAAVRRFSTQTAATAANEPLIAEELISAVPTSTTPESSSGDAADNLGRRLFALVYKKRSAVVALRKWKEEGNVIRRHDLTRMVRELRKLKRYKHAYEVSTWMLKESTQPMSGDYAIHLDLIAKLKGVLSAEMFFQDLPDDMKDASTCNALLHTYVQHKDCDKAEAMMKIMAESGFLTSPLSFNQMLSLYISTGKFKKVASVIRELKKTTSPDIVTYNMWLSVCASQNLMESAEKVFYELEKSKVEPDWVTYSTLTNIYIKNSEVEKAKTTLKEMEKRICRKIRTGYSSMISLHTALENKRDIHRIWKKMNSTYRKLNDSEYTCMIASLLKLNELQEAEKLYDVWESVSPTKDSRVPNLLLAAYINNNQMEVADMFYNRMLNNDIIPGYNTWVLLTYGNLKRKKVEQALDCFRTAVSNVKKWDMDEKLVGEVFKSVEEFGHVESAEQLVIILRDAGYVDTYVYNFLLRTYAKAGKMPLIVEERMMKDNVEMDEETRRLIQVTSKMCVYEIPGL